MTAPTADEILRATSLTMIRGRMLAAWVHAIAECITPGETLNHDASVLYIQSLQELDDFVIRYMGALEEA